jgi:hypothetical protein
VSNKSAAACWLSGTVGLTIIDADQRPITTPVNLPTHTIPVELKPGGSAAATFVYGSARNPPPGQASCAPMMAVFRIVIAESDYSPVVPGWHVAQCPGDVFSVSELVAGTTAPII